jgi:hypothetical protein
VRIREGDGRYWIVTEAWLRSGGGLGELAGNSMQKEEEEEEEEEDVPFAVAHAK